MCIASNRGRNRLFGWDVKPRPRVNRLNGAGSLNLTFSFLEQGPILFRRARWDFRRNVCTDTGPPFFKSHPKRLDDVQLIPCPWGLQQKEHRERESNLFPKWKPWITSLTHYSFATVHDLTYLTSAVGAEKVMKTKENYISKCPAVLKYCSDIF